MFVVGKPVTNKNFFDRTNIIKQVKSLIKSQQDFMIKAPRRYGKTSLIKEALKKQKYIYVDIRRVPKIEMLPGELIEKGYEYSGIYSIRSKIKDNIVKFLSSIKGSIKIDYSIVEASVEYLTKQKDTTSCEDLVYALKTIEKIGQSIDETIIIVFDEFQDIKKFKCEENDILEVLRGVLQHFEFVHCIFLGSIETIMTDIFENKKSPFFNYCRKLKLEAFDIDELYAEIVKALEENGINFENKNDLYELLKKLQGHPANSMVVLQNLYYIALEKEKKLLSKDDCIQAYENGYFEMLDLVEQYIVEIKDKKHYHDVLYKIANNQKQNLSPQALHQVKVGLLNMGYLDKKNKAEYVIIDNFLEKYLQEKII
jgi:AAA+ ATPase superfamily predicted ATPase